jgi:hypothetical protein
MKQFPSLVVVCLLFAGCQNAIKSDKHPVQVEAGTDTSAVPAETVQVSEQSSASSSLEHLLGFWVGYFEPDYQEMGQQEPVYVDEGFIWMRQNKINISLDRIEGRTVIGHSVVAGNDRPFEGSIRTISRTAQPPIYRFEVREPGDDRHDGVFRFDIADGKLTGTWVANRNLEIKYRKYELVQRDFTYDPAIMLEQSQAYVDWSKKIETTEKVEYDEGETEEWVYREYASATEKIYQLNASQRLLTKAEVANLKRGDLLIIRNTIYARHGYSFRNRPLRVFFDAQSWYVPVHADIRSDFTEIEKQNIKLLLSFEKNAAEYYDSFGRG